MFDGWYKILIISSHTDDAELAMGGTIKRLTNVGYEVHHLVLSYAPEQQVTRGDKYDVLINESKKANSILGIWKNNYHLLESPYPTDHFNRQRQKIADTLTKTKKDINPDVIYVNSSFDTHQDHQVTYNECVRVFKEIGIIGYEFPYNNLSFDYDLIVGLTEGDMEAKMDALKCFKSQQDRVYFNEDYIRSLARVNAVRMKAQYPYAEAFEVVRLVW